LADCVMRRARYDERLKKRAKPVLHLAKVPNDRAAQLAVVLAMYRELTGKEPTPKETEAARNELAARGGSHAGGSLPRSPGKKKGAR
jgi:hypothetical protein